MLTQTDIERERYEARLKSRFDYDSWEGNALRRGQAIGKQVGMIQAYERMLRHPESREEQLRTLSLADLTRMAEDLEKQALSQR